MTMSLINGSKAPVINNEGSVDRGKEGGNHDGYGGR